MKILRSLGSTGKWVCTTDCNRIHSTLQKFLKLLSGKFASPETRLLLSQALGIFHGYFQSLFTGFLKVENILVPVWIDKFGFKKLGVGVDQGHLLPMIDIAKILAARGVLVTVITTPKNAARFTSSIAAGDLAIRVELVQFPAAEVGLPEGCEAVDNLPSVELMGSFFAALNFMQHPVEKILEELKPRPSCIIYNRNFTWAGETAAKYQIPRIWFDGKNCLSLLCSHDLIKSQGAETFWVPGLSDRIEFTAAQLPGSLNPGIPSAMREQSEKAKQAEEGADGFIINSFEELETEYFDSFQKVMKQKVWCIGPVSLINRNNLEKARRGNEDSLSDENQCLKWLDSWPPNSVIYACFGSLSRLTPTQLMELGLALEATKRPFIWVIRGARGGYKKGEIEKWLKEDGFEDRIKGRGLLIRGWAPQVLILSHPSLGGFLTHCGWNSTLEGICAGVPMITWPLFSEQFVNEKLVVQILKVGVGVGVEAAVQMGEEEFGNIVKKEDIVKAVERIMEEGEDRRERAKELAKMATRAAGEGGSSYLNITLLIEYVKQHAAGPN
ncbi:hypothetical protein V6N11_043593 [Hibiscus sabdariffa]|uniref:Glycosyltransferase n=1 Tax=Hibiscus sabdariffa TaxID=183260 RepID=A0ABR2RCT8_9ROSI